MNFSALSLTDYDLTLKRFLTVGVIFILFFSSCVPSSNQESRVVELITDQLLVQLPLNTSANLIQPEIWEDEGSELLGAYNYLDHSLSVVNLTKRAYVTRIKLDENGPNFVDPPNGLAYYGDNRFLVSSDKYLTIIDFKGDVLNRLRINDVRSNLTGFDFSLGKLEINRISGLQIDLVSGEVLLEAVKREPNGSFNRYIASVSVSAKTVRLTKVPTFESRSEGEYFGNLNGIHFRRSNRGLIVNPKYASELVLLSSTSSHQYIRSSITKNKASVYSSQANRYANIIEHHLKTVEFYPVFSTYNKAYFFRIHKGPIDPSTEKEPFYLIITDEKFNKLLEVPFPENYYITPIISKEGPMFMAFNKHDDKLELIRYRFN